MGKEKKFGTFGGVFTPSILTILGVIMYLRMGWVVGNGGLWITIGIVLLAHLISIATGLSISSIATDKKVGAGGVYYVLSRSLGLPIGGALGMTLFVATALSIALYMVGFAEIFNEFIGYGYEKNAAGEMVLAEGANLTNTYRVTGSLGLLALTVIAFISTSVAIKSQYIILTAIILSLFSIFLGTGDDGAVVATTVANEDPLELAGFAAIFAIFFPAVTGFTAGVAMSGDLKDPKKAIPRGTLGAIAVGLVVYTGLAIFLYFSIDQLTLINDPKAIFNFAVVPLLVYFGVWGATLSSALGGILGGPRILQAMATDQLAPKVFAKGVGSSNEPRNALILTVIIAEGGILIGDLNVIAEVVSMFYLAAYGFINLSFFLESWASSDFNPTFRVKKWVGLLGFVATVIIMSQLNLLAMVVAFVIIGGIYFFYSRRQIALGTGDIWQSVWATIVKKGLKRMEAGKDHKRNWKPNMLLFSTDNEHRSKMIEFSKAVSGQGGIITNFDLHENPEATVLFPKSKENVTDDALEKYGVFGRRLEVNNVFKGIESIACTFGFSGVEPNTVLMNWPGQTKDPKWFKEMTEKLITLDYNVLYLDYDERWGFRKKEKIDLWWRGVGNNAELMLSLAKFMTSSPDWSQATIRILLVNDTNIDFKVVENRIRIVVDQFRVKAEIKVINNEVDQRPIYDLMKMHSSEADLVFVGIPEIETEEREEFIERTNNLVSVIGTTLLVKASSKFDETDLKLEQIALKEEAREVKMTEQLALPLSFDSKINEALTAIDQTLEEKAKVLAQEGVQPVENYHHAIFARVTEKMDRYLSEIQEEQSVIEIKEGLISVLDEIKHIYKDAVEHQLPMVYEALDAQVKRHAEEKEQLLNNLPRKIVSSTKKKVVYRDLFLRAWYANGVKTTYESYLNFGYQNLILLHQSKNILHKVIWSLLGQIEEGIVTPESFKEVKDKLEEELKKVDGEALHLAEELFQRIRNSERTDIEKIVRIYEAPRFRQQMEKEFVALPNKTYQMYHKGITNFASYWYRNLLLFTYHLQADVYLMEYTIQVQGIVADIYSYITETYLTRIQANIDGLAEELDTLSTYLEEGKQKEVLGHNLRLKEELFFNSEHTISKLLDGIAQINQNIPEEVELMTARSINGIQENQGDEIKTEKISLREITDYIAGSQFVDPVHERVQIYYDQLKRITGDLVSRIILMQKAIDSYALNDKKNALQEALTAAKADIETIKNDFDAARKGFGAELEDRQEFLRKELDVNQIIEHVESLRQYVKQQKRRSAFLDQIKTVNKNATNKLGRVMEYLAKKQQDLTAVNYREQYTDLISEQSLVANFVQESKPAVDLPFYYQQLFTGTYYSDGKTLENRKTEIKAIESTISMIDQGAAGAVAILGDAGMGKTFLATHVAAYLIQNKTYKVEPPVKRTWTKEDLTKGIQRATGINESLPRLFSKLPKKSCLIFDDLEQWWLKAENGDVLLNELAKLIQKYGTRHYFILTGNTHSFAFLKEMSTIQHCILQTVILAPLNVGQIKDVLWSRHQIGGLRIRLNGEKEQHISVNKLNKFLNRFHVASKGNIGLALQQWIESIQGYVDNELEMGVPELREVPTLPSEEWKNLIYQLFLHHNLSREELHQIYGNENKNWVNRILLTMETAHFVERNEKGEFTIIKAVRPYIENWLRETGFIK